MADSAQNTNPSESKEPQASIYSGLQPGPPTDPGSDENMVEDGIVGPSTLPYDVDAEESGYQPGERPQEANQVESQPREALDESAVKKSPMQEHSTAEAPSDMKSTDQLDLKYNDPEAARGDVI